MNIELLSDERLSRTNLAPGSQAIEGNIAFRLDAFASQAPKHRSISAAYATELALHDQSNTSTIRSIHSVLESWHERDEYDTSPALAVLVSSDRTLDQSIADFVGNLDIH